MWASQSFGMLTSQDLVSSNWLRIYTYICGLESSKIRAKLVFLFFEWGKNHLFVDRPSVDFLRMGNIFTSGYHGRWILAVFQKTRMPFNFQKRCIYERWRLQGWYTSHSTVEFLPFAVVISPWDISFIFQEFLQASHFGLDCRTGGWKWPTGGAMEGLGIHCLGVLQIFWRECVFFTAAIVAAPFGLPVFGSQQTTHLFS